MRCAAAIFSPAPWSPGEGLEGQISFNFNFKDFYMFSQMKDTKHIGQDFHSVAWVMPKGWDFGALGCPWGHNFFFQTWSCGISN